MDVCSGSTIPQYVQGEATLQFPLMMSPLNNCYTAYAPLNVCEFVYTKVETEALEFLLQCRLVGHPVTTTVFRQCGDWNVE
jgi:hypothetical protein